MLISPKELHSYWNVSPKGVVHVGAHLAEEAHDYLDLGWHRGSGILWIEAQSKLVDFLSTKLNPTIHRLVSGAAWNTNGELKTLVLTSNSESSSLFELGSHKESYPDIVEVDQVSVRTIRLDSIIRPDESFDFLNLDIQGAELPAIQGLGELISDFKYIYAEVNREELYLGCTQLHELEDYLKQRSFVRVRTLWTKANWGDAFWIRADILPTFWRIRSLMHFLRSNLMRIRNSVRYRLCKIKISVVKLG